MTIEEILNDFRSAVGRFPGTALYSAIAQREEITPELLRILEAAAQDPCAVSKGPDSFLPTFATYLLAQFRDKRAFPLIVKMVTGPGDSAYEVLGESVTLDLGRLLASVYDGNLAALKQVIEDPQMNEYVRTGMLHALLHLVRSHQMAREELVDYLRYLLRPDAERDVSYFWDGIVGIAVELPAPELLEPVSTLFQDPRICLETYMDVEDVKAEMALTEQTKSSTRKSLITDVIEEMDCWACFEPREAAEEESDDFDEDWLDETEEPSFDKPDPALGVPAPSNYEPPPPPTPYVRESPKIGRNDPCPCGSGKSTRSAADVENSPLMKINTRLG